jgi:uncharacterized protein
MMMFLGAKGNKKTTFDTKMNKILKNNKTMLNDQFGVLSIGLFGSYAKGIQNNNSDIDIMVELKAPRFEFLARLQIYLEQKFEKKVGKVRKRKKQL